MSDATIVELDARGLMCPEPIILAQQRMAALAAGQRLRVLTTDPAAPIDFEVWCLRHGHVLLDCTAVEGGHVLTLVRA